MHKRLTIILLALVLSGCGGMQKNMQTPDPGNTADFSAPENNREKAGPPIDFGRELSLDEAIELALQRNPGIEVQRHQTDSARADWREARGKRLPHLSAAASASRYLDDQRLVPARSPGEAGAWGEDQYGADLVLELPLFTGGRLINRASAARLFAEAAMDRLGRTRKETVFNVTSTFYAILEQRKVIESLRFSHKAVSRQQEKIQDLIAVEKGVRVDLLRVRVRLSDIEQQIIAEENRLEALHRLLANLLGMETEQKHLPVQGNLSFENPGVSGDVLWQDIYAARQDYQALKNQAQAAEKSLAAARGEYFPRIDLRGTYGGRWAEGDTTVQAGASEEEDVGSIGLHMEMPLFAGGEIAARTAGARADQAALQARLRELELQIRLEVQNARDAVIADTKRVQTTRAAIEEAAEALDIEQTKYNLGKGTIVDVLDAQDALLRAQTNLARALAAYNTDLARLELARGTILYKE
ncbi:outer membrane protein TolC [Desulfosalsimonas propionicica]|uniref:Outer membrane protein TolC n=1 Tax=Desulfosalsimonas propionicica TaxID=332175 RepID=A0A7W0C8A2_9BACT|nr:TolC family protein [Desulfosalsimonas propionicica]MBA2880915.1 outer membrane protein TolC [Desulfosalsimonas propionicica]